MSGQHTPGPWTPEDGADNRVVVYGGDRCVAVIGEKGFDGVDEDAALIAAAPELLAALERMVDADVRDMEANFPQLDPEETPRIIQARAAIAKARGQA